MSSECKSCGKPGRNEANFPVTIREINYSLFCWWKHHAKHAEKVADKVVTATLKDTYLDEVIFEDADYSRTRPVPPNPGIAIVRIFTCWDVRESEPGMELIIARLRSIFGCHVKLVCCTVTKTFGDED